MIYLLLIAGIFAADYKIRKWINASYLEKTKKKIAGGKLFIRNVHNKGLCGGYGKNHPEEVKTASAFLLGGAISNFLSIIFKLGKRIEKLGNALILGGGLCNYWERKETGSVTDYMSLHTGEKKIDRWVFNLSDVCIAFGILLTVISILIPKKKK